MIEFKSLHQWLQWLEDSHPITDIELGLNRVTQVANQLKLAQPKVPVISVAGTNGKGSVVATLESLAGHHNLNIGSYTSPHLVTFNERIKINGINLSDEILCDAFSYIANRKGETVLTYFEFTTLVALYCFSQEELDFIALEVGLGGRLDATNLVDADISVITSIGLDHTDWLGDTLEDIAYEKAGITRKNKPLVVADKSLLPLLDKAIKEIQPRLLVASVDYQVSQKSAENKTVWSYQSDIIELKKISKSSLYISNQAAALCAFSQLFSELIDVEKSQAALENASLLGRFSTLSKQPHIILDVAHNPDSAALLNKNVQRFQSEDLKIWGLCGMLKDKDIASSLQQMTLINEWLCIDLPEPRGASASELAVALKVQNSQVSVHQWQNLSTAFEYFLANAKDSDLLVVFGSFVTVGQMVEYWQNKD